MDFSTISLFKAFEKNNFSSFWCFENFLKVSYLQKIDEHLLYEIRLEIVFTVENL